MSSISPTPDGPKRSYRSIAAACVTSLVVMFFVLLPSVTLWGLLESPLFRLEEPPSSVHTPNPAKSPFVSQGQELMVYTSPRLASWAQLWSYFLGLVAIVVGLTAPQVVSRYDFLIPASLLLGVAMAWPWLTAIGLLFSR